MKKTALALSAILLTQIAFAKGIEIKDAWARPTVEGQAASGAFMRIENTNNQDDVLISAKSDVATRTEIHTHINDNGVMRMRQVDGVPVAAKSHVLLKPGSYHVMFMNLTKPLKPGDKVNITLSFKSGEQKSIQVPVKHMTDTGSENLHHHH